MLTYITNVDYDIFLPDNLENWKATLEYFYKLLETVERDAKTTINQCIAMLRSVTEGINLIADIRSIKTRKCLVEHIAQKYGSVGKRFLAEISMIEQEFLVIEYTANRMLYALLVDATK